MCVLRWMVYSVYFLSAKNLLVLMDYNNSRPGQSPLQSNYSSKVNLRVDFHLKHVMFLLFNKVKVVFYCLHV